MSVETDNYTPEEYLKRIIGDTQKQFRTLITWSENQRQEFKILVDDLDEPGATTKETGDKLERVIRFIIENSYFYEIYDNVRTETNEIDEVIVLSEKGKIALSKLGISRDVLEISEDIFLGECKNYSRPLNVTYVGKFYSLMTIAGVSFGIIFTQLGLTGDSQGFRDASGLTKVLRMMEQAKHPEQDFNIITFVNEDYQKMISGTSFYDIVKAKKIELQVASNYEQFIRDNSHENEGVIRSIIGELA